MTSRSACAYGRAAATRSCARFIFDVATISIVRVIFRVFSTDLMRVLSSLPFAIVLEVALRNARWLRCADRLLVRLDAALEISFDLLRQGLAGAEAVADLRITLRHELVEALLPRLYLRNRHVVDEAVRHRVDDHDLLLDRHRLVLRLLEHF